MATLNKLSFFIPSLRGGGAERSIVKLANTIADSGVTVDLVLAKSEGPYLKEVSDKVRIIDLNSKRVILCLPRLARYFKNENPDAIISALNYANIIAIIAKKISRTKAILAVSERANLSNMIKLSNRLKSKAIPTLMRWLYPEADHVLAVSEGVADDLAKTIKYPRKKITVIYNPIVTNDLIQRSLQKPEHPWFKDNEPPVILAAGRLGHEKGFSILIKAFSKVRESQNARLIIIGEGELRKSLESLIKELNLQSDVSLPGFIENPYALMRKARIFVLSSYTEGLPGALIEAMACGTPVISTNCPSGPSEILENGRWGILVPVGDIDALAKSILEELHSPKEIDHAKRASFFSEKNSASSLIKALGFN